MKGLGTSRAVLAGLMQASVALMNRAGNAFKFSNQAPEYPTLNFDMSPDRPRYGAHRGQAQATKWSRPGNNGGKHRPHQSTREMKRRIRQLGAA